MWQFTDREADVFYGICEGLEDAEIAHNLSLSTSRVNKIVSQILRKTGLKNRIQVAVAGIKQGEYRCTLTLDFSKLEDREMEVVSYVAQGLTNDEIGDKMDITDGAVQNYLERIHHDRLFISNRVLIATAYIQHMMSQSK